MARHISARSEEFGCARATQRGKLCSIDTSCASNTFYCTFLFQVGELSSLSSDAVMASSGGSHVDSAAAGALMPDAAGPWSASWEATDPPYARIVDTTSEGPLDVTVAILCQRTASRCTDVIVSQWLMPSQALDARASTRMNWTCLPFGSLL